jgi:hypothetical protein
MYIKRLDKYRYAVLRGLRGVVYVGSLKNCLLCSAGYGIDQAAELRYVFKKPLCKKNVI